MCRGESHFSQKSPLANVGESGESGKSRLANVGECIESDQNRLANVDECIKSNQNRLANVDECIESNQFSKIGLFVECSNSPNSLKPPNLPNIEMTVILYSVP
jgi:hypothetical protein